MPLQNSRRQRGLSCQNWDHRNRFRAFFSSYVQKEHKKTSIAFLLNSYSVVTYAFIHLVNVFQLIFVYLYNFRLFYIDDFSFVILNILAMHIGSIPLQFEYIFISYNVYIYISNLYCIDPLSSLPSALISYIWYFPILFGLKVPVGLIPFDEK